MLSLRLGYILILLISVDSSRGDSSWFDCGIQHTCKIFSEPKNWHDAETSCNAEFGHLASISSTTKDRDPIARHASDLDITNYWIGLNHLGGLQDHWRFTDDETVDSNMWAAGYPRTRDPYGLIEMCVVKWADGFHNEHCDEANQYVCKKQSEATQPISPMPKEPPKIFYCPIGYTAIDPNQEPNMGEKCFKFVFLDLTNGVDWDEAVRRCRVQGRKSDIASIHGPYEHEFVRSQMANRTLRLWIGLHKEWEGQGWFWLDNSAYSREDANWRYPQPNDFTGIEDCGEVLPMPSPAMLNDVRCNKRSGYICQTFKDPDNPIMEAPSPHRQNCLVGYTPYQYGCFRLLSTTQKSWEEMRDECRSHSTDTIKSDLVSIHSSAEDATLHIRVMQYGGRAWVGFKENENNTFEWSNSWYPTYTNWGSTAGDDRLHMGCVAMDSGPNGGWYEVDCATALAAICKTTDEEPTKAPFVKNGRCPGEMNGVTSWLKHESYCYLPVSQAKSWQDARLHCAINGSSSTLVSIHSDNENEFVHKNMQEYRRQQKAWIGLYRHTLDKTFLWSDGSPFRYVKWYIWALQRYDAINTDSHCAALFTTSQPEWSLDSCSKKQYPFMCKMQQGPPLLLLPEPTCPMSWHKSGVACYLALNNRSTWHSAEEICQKEGGESAHLATITNIYQAEIVSNIMREIAGDDTYWIGLRQQIGERMYHWIGTGRAFDSGEFHKFVDVSHLRLGISGSCVAVQSDRWIPTDCGQISAYICELPFETARDADTKGTHLPILIPISVVLVSVGIIVIIVVILVWNRNPVCHVGKRRNDRNRTTPVIQNEADGASFSWGTGPRDIYLTPPKHSNQTTHMIPSKDDGASMSRKTGTNECTVYTTRPSHLQYGNLPPQEHKYETPN